MVLSGPVDDRLFSGDAVQAQYTATALSRIWRGRRGNGLGWTGAKLEYSRGAAGGEEPRRTRRGIPELSIRPGAPIVRAFLTSGRRLSVAFLINLFGSLIITGTQQTRLHSRR